MAHTSSEILTLVGQLHEGVVDEAMWERGLDGICDMVASDLLLMGAINQDGRGFELVGHRTDPRAVDLMAGSLANPDDNPWVAAAIGLPLRRPATAEDLGGQRVLERSRLWQEMYLPFGISDSAGAVLERQPEGANIVMMGRRSPKSAFRPTEIKAFGAILPHLARAWRVKRALAEMEGLVGTLRFVLDRLDRAIVVAGPDGKVRFANRAADRLLSRGDGIDVRHGRIRAARHHHTNALLSLINRAAETGLGAETVAVDAVSIPCANDNPPLAIVAEPLAPPHSDVLGHAATAGAILFISDSEASNRPSVERLRIVYGLTPAEAQLTSLIVDGQGIGAAAAALGVSHNTVKYHLKTVFEKIGISRQAQLVRRVLADVGGLAEPETMLPSPSA